MRFLILIGAIYRMESLPLHERVERLRTMFRLKSDEIKTEHDPHDTPYGYIYLITTKSDGKTYIGQRKLACDYYSKDKHNSGNPGWRRYKSSGRDVKEHINSNSEGDVIKTFIAYAWFKTDLDVMETLLIKYGRNIGECLMNHAICAPWPNRLDPEISLGAEEIKKRAEKHYHDEIDGIENTINELYRSGFAIRDISLKLHISRGSLDKFLKRNNVSCDNRINPKTRKADECYHEEVDSIEDIIIDTYKSGISTYDTAKKLHISRNHVRRCLKEHGLLLQEIHKTPKDGYHYVCDYCGKHFTIFRRKVKDKTYCSRICAQLGRYGIANNLDDEIQKCYSIKEMSMDAIAEQLGISHTTVENRLNFLGVPIRKLGRTRRAI